MLLIVMSTRTLLQGFILLSSNQHKHPITAVLHLLTTISQVISNHLQVQHQVSLVQLQIPLLNLRRLLHKIPSTYLLPPLLLSNLMRNLLLSISHNIHTKVTTTIVMLLIITITVVELVSFHLIQVIHRACKIYQLFLSHLTLKVHKITTLLLSSIYSHIYSNHNQLKYHLSRHISIHIHNHLVGITRLLSISNTINSNNSCLSNM